MKIRIPIPSETNPPQPEQNQFTKADADAIYGDISRYNIKMMPDGRQLVINALTGDLMERKDAKYIGDRQGNVLWVPSSHVFSAFDQLNLYKFKNP